MGVAKTFENKQQNKTTARERKNELSRFKIDFIFYLVSLFHHIRFRTPTPTH